MDFKTGKLHKIIREFKKGNGRYEINGIDLENTVFLYREKTSPFIPIPKGNYRTVSDGNENTLIVDDYINNKAVEFQIISIFNVNASKYLEKFPELSMAVEHTNKIVDDINNIIDYLNSVGVKNDSKYQTQILTPLEPSSTWYMNADGVIETLPLDNFNKKFKEIIENISETADEKAQEQVRKRLETLKEEIENFKNTKTSEILENITKKENDSLKEIEKIRDIAKNEINTGVSSINETSSEVLENIKNKKENYISEITTISNNSKKELESKMPEINNKFNAIAGGQINPSFIQDTGEKRIGEYYLDKNTEKLFRCIRTTSSVVNSSEYFKDMSIDSIVNRLENLFKVIEIDTSNFTIVIKYLNDTKQIIGGYMILKTNIRIDNNGVLYNLGNNLTLNENFVTYLIGNSKNIYFYQLHKISVQNGIIYSNINSFSAYTTKVFYD